MYLNFENFETFQRDKVAWQDEWGLEDALFHSSRQSSPQSYIFVFTQADVNTYFTSHRHDDCLFQTIILVSLIHQATELESEELWSSAELFLTSLCFGTLKHHLLYISLNIFLISTFFNNSCFPLPLFCFSFASRKTLNYIFACI